MPARSNGADPGVGVLRDRLDGTLVTPAESGAYDEARIVWNGMIDRRPAAIVRPATVEDVAACVRFAAQAGLPLAVRGGGHSMQGFGTCDDGIVLDLSAMNAVTVDAEARLATVQGGAHIAHVDDATVPQGYFTPMGTVSHTGVAGLTLGGGIGRLTRMHGLAADNVASAQVVLADGSVVRASETENADLFWALRGAGANYGVVTEFAFRLHAASPEIGAALALYDLDHAPDALRALRDFAASAPDTMIAIAAVMTVPPSFPFPEEHHGRRMLMVGGNHFGDPEIAEKELREVTQLAPAGFEVLLRMPYLFAQKSNDERYAWGKRYYVKGGLVETMEDGLVDAAVRTFEDVPGAENEIDFILIGGAASRISEDATAYSGRAARFFVGVDSTWHEPSDDDAQREWTRRAYAAVEPFTMRTNYVNAVEEADAAATEQVYGQAKYARLVEIKRRYDPSNLFRLNNNIAP